MENNEIAKEARERLSCLIVNHPEEFIEAVLIMAEKKVFEKLAEIEGYNEYIRRMPDDGYPLKKAPVITPDTDAVIKIRSFMSMIKENTNGQ